MIRASCLWLLIASGPPMIAAAAAPEDLGSSLDAPAAALVDDTVTEWLQDTKAPSVSIAIVEHGTLVYQKAYGLARVEPHLAAGIHTRYAIDSVSKEFTAAALLLLAEDRKLSLDDPLATWFPNLGPASQATLRQALNHTSGIRDYWPEDFVTPQMTKPITTEALIAKWAASRPLDFPPGSEWQYSNTGYVLAGAIAEQVAGQSLFEFLRRRIFLPLGMNDVEDAGTPAGAGDAAGYTRFGVAALRPAPKEAAGWLFAAAGLVMRPSDLAVWDVSEIKHSLLGERSYQEQSQPTTLTGGNETNYGLGLRVERDAGGRMRLSHGGAGSGFLSENRIWPEDKIAIVVLTNNDWASPSDLADRLGFLVLPPTAEELRARRLFEAFQRGTVDRAQFTDAGKFYLTDEALGDLRRSLGPLGPARLIELEREQKRGGMTTRIWKILCRETRLRAIERSDRDGRLAEFLITRRED